MISLSFFCFRSTLVTAGFFSPLTRRAKIRNWFWDFDSKAVLSAPPPTSLMVPPYLPPPPNLPFLRAWQLVNFQPLSVSFSTFLSAFVFTVFISSFLSGSIPPCLAFYFIVDRFFILLLLLLLFQTQYWSSTFFSEVLVVPNLLVSVKRKPF